MADDDEVKDWNPRDQTNFYTEHAAAWWSSGSGWGWDDSERDPWIGTMDPWMESWARQRASSAATPSPTGTMTAEQGTTMTGLTMTTRPTTTGPPGDDGDGYDRFQ